jgi:hypothetical protein
VLDVLTLRGSRIVEVMGFVAPEICGRFVFPEALPAQLAMNFESAGGL